MKKMKLLFAAAAAVILSFVAQTLSAAGGVATPVAVGKPGGRLVFYYDRLDHAQEGKVYAVYTGPAEVEPATKAWYDDRAKFAMVVFDKSFAQFKPTSLFAWFKGLEAVSSFVGLENLDTSNVNQMNYLFQDCSSLTFLDLSRFDTAKVTDMTGMFKGCSSLATIRVSDGFATENVAQSSDMFEGCTSLVGGKGTSYGAGSTDKTCARIDGAPDAPGYFTLPPTAKAVLEGDGATLRFVYDDADYGTKGSDWFSVAEAEAIAPSGGGVPWNVCCYAVTNVVFDKSFADYRPSQCQSWFACFSIEEISGIENLNTSEATSLAYMFAHCNDLITLDLSHFNTAKAKDMQQMFFCCYSLKTIYASDDFVTAQVTNSTDMLANCSDLRGGQGMSYIEHVKHDKTYACIDRDGARGYFTGRPSPKAVLEDGGATLRFLCDDADHGSRGTDWFSVAGAEPSETAPWYESRSSVTRVIFDASFAVCSPTSLRGWFENFGNVTSVEGLENLDTSCVTSMSYLFYGCSSLTELDLSGFDTRQVADMLHMFSGCESLRTIIAGDLFVTSQLKTSFPYEMFGGCTSLVGRNGTTYDPLCTDKTYARTDRDGAPGYFTLPVMAKAVLEDVGATLRFVYDDADYGTKNANWFSVAEAEALELYGGSVPWKESCTGTVTRVVFDKSFAAYRPSQCACWFSGFKSLETVEGLTHLDTSEATSFASMFFVCQSLTSLDLSGFDTAKVKNMTRMFQGCVKLKTIYASGGFVTDQVTDDYDMFFCCYVLKGEKGTDYEGAQYDIYNRFRATYARIDGGDDAPGYFTLRKTAKAVVEDGGATLRFVYDGAYYGKRRENWYFVDEADSGVSVSWYERRSTVTRVVFDASFTSYLPTSLNYWFKGFSNLTSLEGLENLNTSKVQWMIFLFDGCSSLSELDLSSFDTHQVVNMQYAFSGCTSLRRIVVGDLFVTDQLLTAGSDGIFEGCTSLVGGNGTVYDPAVTDKIYARIDRDGAPGYFSLPLMARAVVENGGTKLRFVYDHRDYGTKGTDWFSVAEAEAQEPTAAPPWSSLGATVTSVAFDPSFASYRPANCNRWFAGFGGLLSWNANGNLDLSEATSMQAMFAGCSQLVLVNLTGLDTANVTDMQSMFQGCAELRTVYADAAFSTESVTESAGMFTGCTGLSGNLGTTYDSDKTDATYARIDADGAPGYFSLRKTAKVVVEDDGATLRFVYDGLVYGTKGTDWFAVADAEANDPESSEDVPWFDCCDTVTKVVFDPSFGQYQPKHLTSWFWGYDKLTEIQGIENLDTGSATSMRYMFSGCSSLKTLDLRSFSTGSVTSLHSMFENCTSLKAIYASEDFTLMSLSDPFESAFSGCDALVGCDGTAYADYGADSAAMARIDRANHGGESGYFSLPPVAKVVLEDYGATLRFVYDGNDYGSAWACYSVAEAEAQESGYWKPWTMSYYQSVTTVIFDASFRDYQPKNCEGWLSGFAKVTEIQGIGNLDTSAVRNMSSMFSGCSKLESLDVSGFDTSSVTNMSWMFSNCYKLESLDVSGFDTSKVTDMSCLFSSCRALAAVDVSGFDTSSVTGTGLQGVFENCSALTELDLSSFDTAKATDLSYMFNGCSSLETIYVGAKFVTTQVTGSEYMFANCTSLVGGNGTTFDAGTIDATYARIDTSEAPGYFSSKGPLPGSFAHWANEEGLAGADAAWDAKPAKWGGQWENAFIYTYGKGLANGSLAIMSIGFDANGKPVITTAPSVYGHDEFTPAVIGTSSLENWTSPVVLERDGDNWTLPSGQEANFFRVRLSNK